MRKCGSEIIWYIVLVILAIIVGGLLISGEILLYLAPRMLPMVWFGFVVLVILSIHQFVRLGKCLGEARQNSMIQLNGLVFLIPIVLMLTAMPNESTSNNLPNRNVHMGSLAGQNSTANAAETDILVDVQDGTETQEKTEKNVKTISGDMGIEDAGPIDPADAEPCIYNREKVPFGASGDLFNQYLYKTTDELLGETITVYGFVYTEDTFPENVILVSRLCFYCCAADAYVIGFYVKVEDSTQYDADDWICVTGKVESITMDFYGEDYDFPILTDGTITDAEIPGTEEAYVYP